MLTATHASSTNAQKRESSSGLPSPPWSTRNCNTGSNKNAPPARACGRNGVTIWRQVMPSNTHVSSRRTPPRRPPNRTTVAVEGSAATCAPARPGGTAPACSQSGCSAQSMPSHTHTSSHGPVWQSPPRSINVSSTGFGTSAAPARGGGACSVSTSRQPSSSSVQRSSK